MGGASLQNALNEQSVTLNLRLEQALAQETGEAQYELAAFTSRLTKVNSGDQRRAFYRNLALDSENSGNRFVSFDRKLEFGASGRKKSPIQKLQKSCIQESFGGN